jgi:large subunit ribosomal protein L15
MVIRRERRSRKLHRTRVWGVGNKKNARGKGTRGGVGRAGWRKSKFTQMTAKRPEEIRQKGFFRYGKEKKLEITLDGISRMAEQSGSKELDLGRHSVLSNGRISEGLTIKARKFSAKAIEKINAAGGKAVKEE